MALSLEQCRAANRRALAALADGDLGEAERWFEAQIDGDCGRFVNRTRFKADPMASIANPTTTRRSSIDLGRRRTRFSDPFDDPFGGGGGGGGGFGGFDPLGDPAGTLLNTACAILGISQCSVTAVIAAGGAALLGLGSDDEDTGDPSVPGDRMQDPGTNGDGVCDPGQINVRGVCVDPGAALPGGDPLFSLADFKPTVGLNGAGFTPAVETRQVRVCPPDHVLGKDNICYDRLPRTRRKWDPGMKPLMTGGDRAAIRKAARAARKLKRSKKQLRKASRALDKVS